MEQEEKKKHKHRSPFTNILPLSRNFWNRYGSWREYYFKRPTDIGCRFPQVCEVCGEPGDSMHMAQKCDDGIYRCNRCRSHARPDEFWFKLFGYTLYDFPTEPIRIKDETNDVIW